MAGTEQTYHVTKQDVRKMESETSARHGGKIPSDSDAAQMRGIVDSQTDKNQEIEDRKSKLPLPEDPPVASDFNSAQQDTVNVGSGRISGHDPKDEHVSALTEPATADSSVRTSGEEWKKNVAPTGDIGRKP